MPPQVIGVFDLGMATIKFNGSPHNVGVISIRTSENESAPVDHIGYCRLNYKDSIIKNLKRIVWAKPVPSKIDKEKEKKAAKIARNSGLISEAHYQKIITSRVCRVCGCTDDDCSQCIEKTGQPCHWIEDDLCSSCTNSQEEEVNPYLLTGNELKRTEDARKAGRYMMR